MNTAALVIGDKESDLVVRTALECAGHACSPFASTAALLRGIKRDEHVLILLDIDDPAADWQAVLDWRRRGMTMLACNSDLGFFTAGARQTLGALRQGLGTDPITDGAASVGVNV